MPYLGNDLQVAQPSYRNIDDISGSFNSSTTSFPLLVSGAAPVPFPINSNQCLISVAGVVQRPDDSGTEGFRISGGNIIFSSAPSTGADFFGVILAGADYVNVGANFPSGSAAVPSITFDSDLDTGIYNSAANQVSITTAGTERLRIDSAGQIEAVSLGTAAAPSFSFTTDPNTGIYSPGADQVAISTNGTGRLFINSSGNVGLGTSSPGAKLQVSQNTDAGTAISVVSASAQTVLTTDFASLSLQNTNTTNNNYNAIGFVNDQGGYSSAIYGIYTSHTSGSQSGALAFSTRNAGTFDERMRITAAGNVGIGTTLPQSILHLAGSSPQLILDPGSGSTDPVSINSWRTNAPIVFKPGDTERVRIDGSGRLLVGTSSANGSQVEAKTADVASGDSAYAKKAYIANIPYSTTNVISSILAGYDSTIHGINIGYAYDGTGYYLAFATNNATTGSPTERMRIGNDGTILFQKSGATLNGEGLQFEPTVGVGITKASGTPLTLNRQTSDGTAVVFYRGTTGVLGSSVGSISVTTTSTTYTTSSDYRLKENVVPLTDAVDRLQQIPVHRFNFIADPGKTVDGFLAHEAQAIVPECVTGEKDAVDDDGNPVYQGIDQSKLVPLLTAALQEAIGRIETLEAEVAALKAS